MNLAECIPIVQAIVSAKIHNCRTLLKRNASPSQTEAYSQMQALKHKAQRSLSLESIRGIEGTAARLYFQHFSSMIKVEGLDFSFASRNRRPPRDPINALLSFGYGCLYREVTMAIQQVGLDPWMGFLHVPESGRVSLALDMMEEFRAILVDSTVLNMVNNNQVQSADFEKVGNGLRMTSKIKGQFLKAFHHRLNTEIMHPQVQVKMSYQRIIQTQVQLLIKALTEVNGTYKGFVTR
jgi:CRISPR-associated protein Cas1